MSFEEKPRVAVVDLRLHYPPQGGACVDLFNVFTRLAARYDVKLFGVSWESSFYRGVVDSACPLPFEIIRLAAAPSRERIVEAVAAAVESWAPGLVFIADGWTLKPYLAARLAERRKVALRLYSYECLCLRTNERWLYSPGVAGRTCGNTCLEDDRRCLACADDYRRIVRHARNGEGNPLIEEAEVADIWRGDYPSTLRKSLSLCAGIICYNQWTCGLLASHTHRPVRMIPGGVDSTLFHVGSVMKSGRPGLFRILVPGRMDAASKGGETAIAAGALLAARGVDFEMWVTRPPKQISPPSWLREIGFHPHSEMPDLLRSSDCVVVPSLWEEAFGMAWLEAMACGIPVVASRVGAMAELLRDGDDALLFPPGDSVELASHLSRLMLDVELGRALASAGMRKAHGFSWENAADATDEFLRELLTMDSAVAMVELAKCV